MLCAAVSIYYLHHSSVLVILIADKRDSQFIAALFSDITALMLTFFMITQRIVLRHETISGETLSMSFFIFIEFLSVVIVLK